ncbi:LAFE_0C02850g1_1 [Lachancea fermentati]|uniref:LAFE_0C02850g1_1 n=1 Tax=Lachancea fermentati TaxID=4955 RepID=A0A1G4M977_LACFM|nr:LAFE_0C02850g1_1 [Lachancea fermentati]
MSDSIEYPTEDDVFSFSLANQPTAQWSAQWNGLGSTVTPPLLSNTPDSYTHEEHEDEFLISSPLMYAVQSNGRLDDDLFRLDQDELACGVANDASFAACSATPRVLVENSESELFANAAQENYRLWLTGV